MTKRTIQFLRIDISHFKMKLSSSIYDQYVNANSIDKSQAVYKIQ